MLKLLLFTTLGGFSGGGMYLLTVDLYSIYISKTQLYSSNLPKIIFFYSYVYSLSPNIIRDPIDS